MIGKWKVLSIADLEHGPTNPWRARCPGSPTLSMPLGTRPSSYYYQYLVKAVFYPWFFGNGISHTLLSFRDKYARVPFRHTTRMLSTGEQLNSKAVEKALRAHTCEEVQSDLREQMLRVVNHGR